MGGVPDRVGHDGLGVGDDVVEGFGQLGHDEVFNVKD